MTGRGFLKKRLAELERVQETENPSNPEEPPTQDESIPKILSVPGISATALAAGQQSAVRGRRAMLAHMTLGDKSKTTGLMEKMTAQYANLELSLKRQAVSQAPVCGSSEVPKSSESITKPQLEPIHVESPIEEKSPVIYRVPPKSAKDVYQMTPLSSNYIKLNIVEDKGVYEYRVDFNPPVDAKSAKFFLVAQHQDLYPVKSFDGSSLYVPKMLPNNVTNLVGKLRDDSEVSIRITFKRKSSLRECTQFYNVFLRKIMKVLGLVEFGKSFYDKDKKIYIPEYKLEVWPGYVTVVDEFESGLFMCCEVSHRVLRVQTALEVMLEVGLNAKQNNKDSKQEITSILLGSTVITHYNNKTYRVDDIDFSMTPLSTFDQNGTQLTFVDYYKKMYNIEIKNLTQPMLITKMKRKDMNPNRPQDSDIICLVPELCNLTGLTEAMKSNFKLMKALQAHTLINPETRQKGLVDFINRLNGHEKASQKFKEWGLQFLPVPVRLEGPVYKRETILLGNNLRKQVGINMDWGIDVAKSAMFVAVNLKNWAILYNPKEESTAKSFCKQLVLCGRPLGMEINPPVPVKVQGMSPEVFVSNINSVLRTYIDLQLIVIIFPNLREDRYNAVKRICVSDIGIPSQIILSRTLSKPDRISAITQKIALQINCKLGGACWAIDIPLKNTMIVGIDTYHEKGKQLSSVVGIVASMDKTFTEWASVAGMQKSTHQELMQSVQEAFHKVVQQFKKINGVFPDKIIIYRDGVSDGDLKHVENVELHELEQSFKSYPGNYCPMITCVIVQKRISTRVFQYINEKYSNPPPGSVIDNTVTKRDIFDFYLVSQNVRQGTVNPTHYIILKNGCKLSTENIQRLSYKLCHLYYNWCGTVKVPAPVQYAHKLAYLIGQNVRQPPKDELCNSLFFL